MKEVEWQVIDHGSLFSAAYRIPLELFMPCLARLPIDVSQHTIGIGVTQLPRIPNGNIQPIAEAAFRSTNGTPPPPLMDSQNG